MTNTYRSACLVVVEVHLLAQVAAALAGVHEFSGELEAVADVVGAAAPLPVPQAVHGGDLGGPGLVAVVTRTGLYAALTARPGDGVRHAGARDRIYERRLSAPCNTRF